MAGPWRHPMPISLRRATLVASAILLAAATAPGTDSSPASSPAPSPAPSAPAAPAGAPAAGHGQLTSEPAANATAEKGAPVSEFFESIDVDIVNVNVYVTDKKGNRIHGLKAEDFEL